VFLFLAYETRGEDRTRFLQGGVRSTKCSKGSVVVEQ
jgi:hypothetical protein